MPNGVEEQRGVVVVEPGRRVAEVARGRGKHGASRREGDHRAPQTYVTSLPALVSTAVERHVHCEVT